MEYVERKGKERKVVLIELIKCWSAKVLTTGQTSSSIVIQTMNGKMERWKGPTSILESKQTYTKVQPSQITMPIQILDSIRFEIEAESPGVQEAGQCSVGCSFASLLKMKMK